MTSKAFCITKLEVELQRPGGVTLNGNRKQEIEKEAKNFVDAARHFHEVGRHVSSVSRLGVGQLLNAKSDKDRKRISEEQREQINRSVDEAQRRLSQPIMALNNLVHGLHDPLDFTYGGREFQLIRKQDETVPYQNFSVYRSEGEVWELV